MDDGEQWKPIPGYMRAEASSLGRIRFFQRWQSGGQGQKTGRWEETSLPVLRQPRRKHAETGYFAVDLIGLDGKRRRGLFVHALVLTAFHGTRPHGMSASHLNGDRSDNRIANLCWESMGDNLRRRAAHGTLLFGARNPKAKLTESQASWAMEMVNSRTLTGRAVARLLGVSGSAISSITTGSSWKHVRRLPRARKPHCPRGHAYDESNTYVNPKGANVCRVCARENYASRQRAKGITMRRSRYSSPPAPEPALSSPPPP